MCGGSFPQKRGSKKSSTPLVLKINFKEAKQVLCSAVSFRRKPKAVHKVALLSTGEMVRNREPWVRALSCGTGEAAERCLL